MDRTLAAVVDRVNIKKGANGITAAVLVLFHPSLLSKTNKTSQLLLFTVHTPPSHASFRGWQWWFDPRRGRILGKLQEESLRTRGSCTRIRSVLGTLRSVCVREREIG
jgi:hypothetical protein